MKKTKLLNAPISAVIAELGHTDTIVICDAGLPIPKEVERIDLALVRGTPAFFPVLDAVTSEMTVERVIIASEMKSVSPAFYDELMAQLKTLKEKQGMDVSVEEVPHEIFKIRTEDSSAIVRTGECTPYANVILVAGVSFKEA